MDFLFGGGGGGPSEEERKRQESKLNKQSKRSKQAGDSLNSQSLTAIVLVSAF